MPLTHPVQAYSLQQSPADGVEVRRVTFDLPECFRHFRSMVEQQQFIEDRKSFREQQEVGSQIDELRHAYLAGDPSAIQSYFYKLLARSSYPNAFPESTCWN